MITEKMMKAYRHVMYYFYPETPGAHSGGDFMTHLLRTFAHADATNFAKLTEAFPEEGNAMHLAMHVEGGIDAMTDIITARDARTNRP